MTCVDMPRRSWRVREVAITATHQWLAHLPRRLLFGTSRHVGAFCVPSRQPLAAATRAAHDMFGHAPQILARARGRYHCHAPVACTFATPAACRHLPANKHGGARSEGSGGRSAGGRHPEQASRQPGAACAPLGEQAPPLTACFRFISGRVVGYGMSDQHLEKRQVLTPCTNTHTHTHGGAQVPSFEITHTHTHSEGGGRQGRCGGVAQIR